MSACCSPSHEPTGTTTRADDVEGSGNPGATVTPDEIGIELIDIPSGAFWMGSRPGEGYDEDGEGPVHKVTISGFRAAITAVTYAQFAAFADATGWRTQAEDDGWAFVFAGLLPDDFPPTRGVAAAPWWRQAEGADWRHPDGPQSSWEDRADHPVVHVSWDDARAFCAWSGTRLLTEAEWEWAARGGLDRKRFPWGDDLEPDGAHLMNVFQGEFPVQNTLADGFAGTAPVRSFPANGYGLYEVTGNVWEWCADWFDPHTYTPRPETDPVGPSQGTHRVMRGGSYLCHHSYCTRYRVAARSANTPDSATGNIGFRVAASP